MTSDVWDDETELGTADARSLYLATFSPHFLLVQENLSEILWAQEIQDGPMGRNDRQIKLRVVNVGCHTLLGSNQLILVCLTVFFRIDSSQHWYLDRLTDWRERRSKGKRRRAI
jgi:hypothetical protein